MSASNEYWTGNGNVWVDDTDFEKIKGFEVKMLPEWEEVPNGLTTERVLLGVGYEGSMSYRKTDKNRRAIMDKIFAEYSAGRTPDITIVGKAYNKATGKTERIKVSGITFDELILMKWEEKSVVEQEIAFKASRVDVLQ